MKKSTFLAALGLAIGVVNSHGQGFVFFSSYLANNGVGATTTTLNGDLVSSGWTAYLFYFIGTVSDPVDDSSWASTISLPTGLTDSGFTAPYMSGFGSGYFDGGWVAIPGYIGGPITFEVVVYNGTWLSRSGSFTMDSIALPGKPAPALGDNGQQMPNIIVFTPEPSSLTLAGLGSLMALVVIHHEQKSKTAHTRSEEASRPRNFTDRAETDSSRKS